VSASHCYTPGPWEILDDESGVSIVSSANAGDGRPYIVMNINMECPGEIFLGCGTHEPMANARLIAAAPDLIEACEKYLDAMERYGHPDKTDRLMRAAIKKAKGG